MDPPVLRSCRLCATLPAATALARAFEASFLPLPPTHPPRAGSKAGCGRLWGGGVLGGAAASQAPPSAAPRPAPGSLSAEEGVLPVPAEFLGVSPQACPRPVCGCRAGPARQTSSARRDERKGKEDTAEDAWELIPETWASRDMTRTPAGLGGTGRSSHLRCQGRSGAGRVPRRPCATSSREKHQV